MKRKFNFLRFFAISILGTLGIVLIFNIKSIDQLTFRDFAPIFTVFIIFGIKDFRKYLDYKKSINEGIALISNCSSYTVLNLCRPHNEFIYSNIQHIQV